jgi:cytochrome c oxidase subunit 2
MWDFPLFPEQASTNAWKVDLAFGAAMGVLLFFTTLVCLLIIYFAIYYRRGRRANRANPPTHSVVMEIFWIGIPLLIGMSLFSIGTVVFFELYSAPSNASTIYVVGKQWMWKLQHPEGKREINELHVPLGRPVRLLMTSQDVIHSFFIPAFRIKQDVLPRRYTELWFNPTKVGKHHLFCAEYCGTDHSAMIGTVHVMDPADYEEWLTSGDVGPAMARQGEELFVRHHCAGCHGEKSTVNAPKLDGIYGRPVPIQDGKDVRFVIADDRYIRDSILLPEHQVVAGYEPVMPSFQNIIDEEDLLKIIEYIKSIGPKKGAER